jgi:hypothetical protein
VFFTEFFKTDLIAALLERSSFLFFGDNQKIKKAGVEEG